MLDRRRRCCRCFVVFLSFFCRFFVVLFFFLGCVFLKSGGCFLFGKTNAGTLLPPLRDEAGIAQVILGGGFFKYFNKFFFGFLRGIFFFPSWEKNQKQLEKKNKKKKTWKRSQKCGNAGALQPHTLCLKGASWRIPSGEKKGFFFIFWQDKTPRFHHFRGSQCVFFRVGFFALCWGEKEKQKKKKKNEK